MRRWRYLGHFKPVSVRAANDILNPSGVIIQLLSELLQKLDLDIHWTLHVDLYYIF